MLSNEQHLLLESQLVALLTGKIKLLQSKVEHFALAKQQLEILFKQAEFNTVAQAVSSEDEIDYFLQKFFILRSLHRTYAR